MNIQEPDFKFLDPGQLVDGELELVLENTRPPGPTAGLVSMDRFDMLFVGTGTKIGSICLRTWCTIRLNEYGGNLSYHVDEEYLGNKNAARGCRLLFHLATSHKIDSLLISCRPDNLALRKTCELIGAELGTRSKRNVNQVSMDQFVDTGLFWEQGTTVNNMLQLICRDRTL